jgi:hypothetical protein
MLNLQKSCSSILLAFICSIFATPSMAQIVDDQPEESQIVPISKAELPKFEDFPVVPISDNQNQVAPDIDLQTHPQANEYQSHLRTAMRRGPNFAGHYSLISWECGADCLRVAIIDVATGAVYFPRELAYLGALKQFDIDSAVANKELLTYRLNSNLLIAVGYPSPDGETRKDGGIFYYAWENNRLILITQVKMSNSTTLP